MDVNQNAIQTTFFNTADNQESFPTVTNGSVSKLVKLLLPRDDDRKNYLQLLKELQRANDKRQLGNKIGNKKRNLYAIVKILIKLGDLYINYAAGQEENEEKINIIREYSGYAAMFYNAALKIEEENCLNLKNDVTEKLSKLKDLVNKYFKCHFSFLAKVEYYRALLITFRHEYKKNLKASADSLNFSNTNDDYLRASRTHNILKDIAKDCKAILIEMLNSIQAQLGNPPCQYAVILFGSFAKESATPFSDLEFGILIEDKDDKPLEKENFNRASKEYFKNLTALLALQIMALGETAIPLELLKTEGGIAVNLDDLLVPGFQFDLGGKTPLNRKRLEDVIDPITLQVIYAAGADNYDLIATPTEMAKYIEDEVFSYNKLLAIEVAKAVHLEGNETLTKDFNARVMDYLQKMSDNQPRYRLRAKQILAEEHQNWVSDLKRYEPKFIGFEFEKSYFNVKQEIYRLPDRLLEALALYFGIYDILNNWDMLDKLCAKNCISQEAAKNLKIAEAIASEIRLRHYLHCSGQNDRMPIFSSQGESDDVYNELLYLNQDDTPQKSLLFRYYYTTVPFYEGLSNLIYSLDEYEEQAVLFSSEAFNNNSLVVQGKIYVRTMQYQKAIDCLAPDIDKRYQDFSEIIKQNRYIAGWSFFDLKADLILLVNCYGKIDDYTSQENYLDKILKLDNSKPFEVFLGHNKMQEGAMLEAARELNTILKHNMAVVLFNSASNLLNQHQHERAIDKFEQTLKLYWDLYSINKHIAEVDTLEALGIAYLMKSEKHWLSQEKDGIILSESKASKYFDEAISACSSIPIEMSKVKKISLLLNSSNILKDFKSKDEHLTEALSLAKFCFGINHSATAKILCALGKLYYSKNREKAIAYLNQALNILSVLERLGSVSILQNAGALCELGGLYIEHQDYLKAEATLEKILSIYEEKSLINSSSYIHFDYAYFMNCLIRSKLHLIYDLLLSHKKEETEEKFGQIDQLIQFSPFHQKIYLKNLSQRYPAFRVLTEHDLKYNTFYNINSQYRKNLLSGIILGFARSASISEDRSEAKRFYEIYKKAFRGKNNEFRASNSIRK